jgi:hypothetical protein
MLHVGGKLSGMQRETKRLLGDVIFTICCMHIRRQMTWHERRFEEIDWRCQVYYLLHEYSVVKDLACKENGYVIFINCCKFAVKWSALSRLTTTLIHAHCTATLSCNQLIFTQRRTMVRRGSVGSASACLFDSQLGTTGRSFPLSHKRRGDGERPRRMYCMNVLYACDWMIVLYECYKKYKNKQKEWHTATKPLDIYPRPDTNNWGLFL